MSVSNYNEMIAARRKLWFGKCRELGVDENMQRDIADGVIPDKYPGKYTPPDGEISRKLLFTNARCWTAAWERLVKMESVRRAQHRPVGGTKSNMITERQLKFIYDLEKKIAWANGAGDPDLMRLNTQKLAARLTGNPGGKTVRMLKTLRAIEARNLIQAMMKMVKNAAD